MFFDSEPKKRIVSDIVPPKRKAPPPPVEVEPELVHEKEEEIKEPVVKDEPRRPVGRASPSAGRAKEAPSEPVPVRKREELKKMDTAAERFFAPREAVRDLPAAEPKRKRHSDELKVVAWESKGRPGARLWVWIGGTVGALFGMAILLSTVFARMTVTIVPVEEAKALPPISIKVTPDAPAINVARGTIPGEIIEFQESRELVAGATGRKTVSERARGTMVIFNAFSAEPQQLVQATRFQAPDGKMFRLEKAVTVPGAKISNGEIVPSSVEAVVIAAEPGSVYNITKTKFRIPGFEGTPKYQGFYGESKAAFSGGFEGEANVATEADIKKASEAVTAELVNYLKESLMKKTPDGFVSIEGGREAGITNLAAPNPGAPGDTFRVIATGKVRAIIMRADDEAEFIGALFSTTTPKVLKTEGSKIERRSIVLDLENRQLSYTLAGTAVVQARIDQESIKSDLVGQREAEIEAYLSGYQGITSFETKFFPIWLWRAPAEGSKVNIRLES